MLNTLITLYCIRYDPIRCECDPERVWQLVQSAGGSVQSINYGVMDFYVPERIVSVVMLLDPELRIVHARSYI